MTAEREQPVAAAVGHGRVWRLAGPIILSNITVPLLGAVDTAVVGHLPEAWHLGAVAVGAMIFNFLYWAFGFLRMGTTGLTAQAYGAGDGNEVRANLARALLLALVLGLAMVLLQWPIEALAFHLLEASPEVEQAGRLYVQIRIWAAPAALAGFALLGWFIGIQNTRAALLVQLAMNGLNMVLDLLFVLGFGWGVAGVAAATLIAQYAGLALGLWLVRRNLAGVGGRLHAAAVFETRRLNRLFAVNFDIFLRSLFLLCATAYFTAQGARQGDVVLAANAVLINFVHFLAFGLDGFAFAAEALIGGAIGARNLARLRQAVRLTSLWAGLCALAYLAVYLAASGLLIGLLTSVPEVREAAVAYLPWVLISPLIAVWGYQLDGIFIGATRTADMRNGMAIALLVFLVADQAFRPLWGNHGLWLAMTLMWVTRAATLAARYPALERAVVPPAPATAAD